MKTSPISCVRMVIIHAFSLLVLLAGNLSVVGQQGPNSGNLSVSISSTESRCRSTGSIQISVSGGSGQYNYKIVGPVTTDFTSSNNFSGLLPGTYEVQVLDVVSRSSVTTPNVVIAGSYTDPRFIVIASETVCNAGNNGWLMSAEISGGREAYLYRIVGAPNSALIGSNNTSGFFSGLQPGTYLMQMEDSCGGIQTRAATIIRSSWVISGVNGVFDSCGTVRISMTLRDDRNRTNADTAFKGFSYGIIGTAGDTIWSNTSTIRMKYGKQRRFTVLAKDGCGNLLSTEWIMNAGITVEQRVNTSRVACNVFTATMGRVTNMAVREYYLYNASNTLIGSNNNGTFSNLSGGSYTMAVKDRCYDTTVSVPFTVREVYPPLNTDIVATRVSCATFDAQLSFPSTFVQPNVCLYRGTTLVGCNTTGVFRDLPYGRYSMQLTASCFDTVYVRNVEMNALVPSVSGVSTSNFQCSTFDAQVTGISNLSGAVFALYQGGNVLQQNDNGNFVGVPYGNYEIRIINNPVCYDTVITLPVSGRPLVPSVSNRFMVDGGCRSIDIVVWDQKNLYNEKYYLYDRYDILLDSNQTGVFVKLPYGKYCVRVKNAPACYDTVLTVCDEIFRDLPQVGDIVVTQKDCNTFNSRIDGMKNLDNPFFVLKNSSGFAVDSNGTGIFANVPYGQYCIEMRNNLICNDTAITKCFSVSRLIPSGGSVTVSNITCPGFRVTVGGLVNFFEPVYVLRTEDGTEVQRNQTGVFDIVGRYRYGIEVINKSICYDTSVTIWNMPPAKISPTVSGVSTSNLTCSGFTVSLNNPSGFTNPVYQVLNNAGTIILTSANSTINNIPYGSYRLRIIDGCWETPFEFPFSASRSLPFLVATAQSSCTLGTAQIHCRVSGLFPPYTYTVYNHLNQVLATVSRQGNIYVFTALPALPAGTKYRIEATDSCGSRVNFTVPALIASVRTTKDIIPRCPSLTAPNGSADLRLAIQSTGVPPINPVIIQMDGRSVNMTYQSVSSGSYFWNSLMPATYIIRYDLLGCTNKLFDTVQVKPYTFPVLEKSAIYQCDNNSITVSTKMQNGLPPYQYQIISSIPATPSLASSWQVNPVFFIQGSQQYSLVRLRGVDVCGNAALNDAGLLPMEIASINSTGECLNTPVTLRANLLSNATYAWYKMSGRDSLLVSTTSEYAIPSVQLADTGTYKVYMNVNQGCYVSTASYYLSGSCMLLPVYKLNLMGKISGGSGQLRWDALGERNISRYIVERGRENSSGFSQLFTVPAKSAAALNEYAFVDSKLLPGINLYRIKAVDAQDKIVYSNTISLNREFAGMSVYPNPARHVFHITINPGQLSDVKIQLLTLNGQLLQEKYLPRISQSVVSMNRGNLTSGVYMIRVINLSTGQVSTEKLILE